MNRPSRLPSLTAGQAQYILNRMAQERKLNSADVSRYMADMKSEISDLEARLGMLKGALAEAAPAVAAAAVPVVAAVVRRRRRGRPAGSANKQAAEKPARAGRPLRKEVKASQQLQGIYLSLIKQMPKEKRPPIQKLCKEQGRQVAIDKMKAMLRK